MVTLKIILALIVLANGQRFSIEMDSQVACESFTVAMGPHVESANCETYTLELEGGYVLAK